MTTNLTSVVLHGVFKNQPVVARFDRFKRADSARSIGWTLAISIGGKCHRFSIEDKSLKPCWTVACNYMDEPARRLKAKEATKQARVAQAERHAMNGLKIVR